MLLFSYVRQRMGRKRRVQRRGVEEPVVAFVARPSADEWEKIIPYDRTQNR